MANHFYAYISRMRCVKRWALMRNTEEENIQEHSHMVAVLAHGLALIRRDILGLPADPERCATAALFHDASEILTGDLPTPVKYYNPDIRAAYKQVERVSADKLLELLPEALRPSYAPLVRESDPTVHDIVKAADKLSAHIKCIEELKAVLKENAERRESYVVLGRCAEDILQDNDGLISIFLVGDTDVKQKRIMEVKHVSADEALTKMKRHDKSRKQYHNSFSSGKWGDSRYYDVCINTSRLGLKASAEELIRYIDARVAAM